MPVGGFEPLTLKKFHVELQCSVYSAHVFVDKYDALKEISIY